jgi:site-specific DNA-cytosine methylase
MDDFKLLTGETLQEALGVSRTTLWRLRQQGMPTRRIGRGIRYPLEDVRAWLAAQRGGQVQLTLAISGDAAAGEIGAESGNGLGIRVPAPVNDGFAEPEGAYEALGSDLAPCHWSSSVALDPKHRPQAPDAPSSTVRKDWRKYPQEAHLLDAVAGRFRRFTEDEIAVLQGFPASWGRDLGLSHRERVAGLGNAVPPPVGEALYSALREILGEAPRTAVEICAGFGGLALGAHRATGFDLLALVEFWEAAVRVLRASPHWDPSRVHLCDVKAFSWAALAGTVDVLSGGPPCQPWSTAGHSRGAEDERDLLGEMPSIVRTIKPRAFIFENVPGLLTPTHSGYVEELVRQLRQAGSYGVAIGIVQAADYGVPQRRKRVVIAGFREQPDAVAHAFFDKLHELRSHADPSRGILGGKEPWVTISKALPEWKRISGWRRWIDDHKKGSVVDPASNPDHLPEKKMALERRSPVMGLVWPGRDRAVEWSGTAWSVAEREDSVSAAVTPLMPKNLSTRPLIDPWYVHGDTVRSLEALRVAMGRRAKLVYYEPPRLDTDLVSFASEDARGRLDTWLSLNQASIRRAATLVRDDGVLAVLTGVAEQPYLQVMLDEMFGPENRVGTVVWQKGYSVQGQKKDRPKKEIYSTHDYVIFYSRRAEECLPGVALKGPPKNFSNDDGDPRGPWKAEQKGANYHRASSDFSVNLPPYRWEVIGGTTPPWFWRVSPKSGIIWAAADEVREAGSWSFRVRVTDSGGSVAEKDFTICVKASGVPPTPTAPRWLIARDADGNLTNAEASANAPKASKTLRFLSKDLPVGVVGKAYYACIEADGGVPYLGTTRPGKSSGSGKSRYWDLSYETLEKAAAEDAVDFKAKDDSIPAAKVYLDGATFTFINQISTWRGDGKAGAKKDPTRVGWGQDAKKELEELLVKGIVSKVINISKPSGLMTRIMALFTNEHDVVVDIGSPAAEMAAVSCQLRRHSVYVEMPGTDEDGASIRLPRLRSAARGEHPIPDGVLFFANSGTPAEDGFYVGRRAREQHAAADVCEFSLGSPLVLRDTTTRTPRVDYSTYKSGSITFLQALASSEGLAWIQGESGEFARSLDGSTIAVHLDGTAVLDGRMFESLAARFAAHLADPEKKLRIYFHRGFGDVRSATDGQVELRHIPFDLLLAAGG